MRTRTVVLNPAAAPDEALPQRPERRSRRYTPGNKDWLDKGSEFFAGWADVLTLGLTKKYRELIGADHFVDTSSGWYQAGEGTGVVHEVLMAVASGGGSGVVRVASSAGKATRATIVRTIRRGERVSDLINELAYRTWVSSGKEHAIVSLKTGKRIIVIGSESGIDFGKLTSKIRRVIIHTHPTPTGPSMDDLAMLHHLGQKSSWIYELFGGGPTKFWR